MFKKILVANRGEIAVRVIRTARAMGVQTVAVASVADRDALHAKLADEVVEIGGPEPATSYLDVEKILDAARSTGSEAIHPGYGFLSERAEFARACREAGVTFIGPSPEAMDRLGAKIDAKQLAVENGVPVTPGLFEPGASDERLKHAASEIGYPVMLKASAGGGGRGMRLVRDPAEFDHEMAMARVEAVKAFGDGAMMVEKLVERPRHIEVQVLADSHGQVACLFERECSIQRRHQKLIEEAPSPVMTEDLWARMGDASRRLVAGAGYVGAGTVEFMYDEPAGEFYFLEVNARLQVEHPVTEAITGLDLVEWQLRIAAGEPLALPAGLLEGDRRRINGHAIEVRIVAEDPAKGFLPSTGEILGWAEPHGLGVRFDTGFGLGAEVSRYYDSLIAKLIVHRESRAAALKRLQAALMDTHILGPATNISYILDVLAHPSFGEGRFDTAFLGREFADWTAPTEFPAELATLVHEATARPVSRRGSVSQTPVWDRMDGFQIIDTVERPKLLP
ncbi:MAG: ATP-grasp domain-containing protein [Fimbriimonadaceae bacterium]|nr:ATP-grasp domain-containing protein [Fimbriimonadaceae bacterium]QYK54783.1 MAG: ATP-grasp domain-containing protein [Fimbriimonadaceae bacterium]